jgi:hypothetical protein
MCWNGSSHMLKVCLLKERRQSWLQPLMKRYWEEMLYEDTKDSSGWNSYILLILYIGMSYYQWGCNTNLRQVSSAQTNRTQVLIWEETLSTAPALFDLRACSLQGWISLETSFPESPRSLKMEFGIKSYGIFREMTYAISGSCGSATNSWGSAAPYRP